MKNQKELQWHGLFYTIGYLKGIYNNSANDETKKHIEILFKDLEIDYNIDPKHLTLKENE